MNIVLNDFYSRFLSGELTRDKFEGVIFTYLFKNKELTHLSHWKNDEYEDFLSWFYPRLRRSIDSYRDLGASFEIFLNKFLLTSSKEYRVNTVSKAVIEYSAWSAKIPEMYTHEEPPAYSYNNTEDFISFLTQEKENRNNSKRVLALVIKCYNYISEDLAERIAPIIGLKSHDLLEMLKKIRKKRQEKDDRYYYQKERIYCQFYRCIIYDKKLSLLNENTTAYNKVKLQLEKARQRLENMRSRMINARVDATNEEVAEVIGIKKGTVDSSLYQLKSKLIKMSKKAHLN